MGAGITQSEGREQSIPEEGTHFSLPYLKNGPRNAPQGATETSPHTVSASIPFT